MILSSPNVSGFPSLPISATRNCYQPKHGRLQVKVHNHDNEKYRYYTIDSQIEAGERNKIGTTNSHIQTFCASIALGVLLVFSVPLDANAGFGPSSGATTSSPPNLIAPSIQDKDIEYNAKKLKQLIGSTLDENRLREFSMQLDELADGLKNLLAIDDDVEEVSDGGGGDEKSTIVDMAAFLTNREERKLELEKAREGRKVELEKARVLQEQIADREKLLAKLEKQPYWFNYLSAFVGSVASTLVMHPVDTIKTRMQVNRLGRGRKEDDNISSLYEGLTGNILKEGPPSALYLGVYESVKYSLLPLYGPQYKLLIYLAAGAAGELLGSVVRAPAEAIKSTVQSGIAGSASEAAIRVFGTKESRMNIVRAWSASVWRDVPFGAIQLALFELIKAYILNNPDIDFDSSTLTSEALIGAFAGGTGALLTNPFDIITTRIITQSTSSGDDDGGDDSEGDYAEPLGVIGMGKRVYKEGGPAAFMVGWQARVFYWAPAISIFLSCYCSVRQAGVENGWFS